MKPLLYLVRKSIANTVRSILKSPGKLALWIVVIVFLAVCILASFLMTAETDSPTPLFWFSGVLFAFITITVVVSIVNGMSGGDAIFEMNDVNLLFGSPIRSQKILLYGIIKMAKAAFLMSFFVLFQSTTLANFGIDYGGVFITFVGTILAVMTMLTVSLVIYCVTNGRPRRKLALKLVVAALFAPLVVVFAMRYAESGDVTAVAEAVIDSPLLTFIPVAGWTTAGVTSFIVGINAMGFFWFGLDVLLAAGMIAYVMLSNPDFYEDVLVATETAFQKKRAALSGDIGAATVRAKKVKVKSTGITGNGAAAILGKHMRESLRENKFGLLTLMDIIVAAAAICLALIIRDLIILMQIMMWMQIFLIGTGRGLKETFSHYIYMIPETSFRKIVWSNMEIAVRTLIESVLIFGISAAVMGASPILAAVCILAYTLFSYLLIAVNYFVMRFTGADISSGILILIYFGAVIIAMIPGLFAAILVGVLTSAVFGIIVMALWELIAGTILFAISKGILHTCDMAMVKMK